MLTDSLARLSAPPTDLARVTARLTSVEDTPLTLPMERVDAGFAHSIQRESHATTADLRRLRQVTVLHRTPDGRNVHVGEGCDVLRADVLFAPMEVHRVRLVVDLGT